MSANATTTSGNNTYTNPIVAEPLVDLGDPGALFYNGFYYLATSSGDSPSAFPLHRSHDLVNWVHAGYIFPDWGNASNPPWASGDFWAPDLQIVGGRFACYYSARARDSGILSLGVAFSDDDGPAAAGSFVDIGQPLWQNASDRWGTIDVHYHESSEEEGGGIKMLLWKSNQDPAWTSAHIMMQRLSEGGDALVGDAWAIVKADQPWEKYGCVEAPWLVKHSGSFYLFYSASTVRFKTYAIGVARADTIEGPYEKKREPVLHTCGYDPPTNLADATTTPTPGHCSVLPVLVDDGEEVDDDRWVMFYHGRDVDQPQTNRTLMMDELHWGAADGWPYIEGDCPSSASRPVP